MTESEYDKIPAVRWSRLKALRVSPKQYAHELRAEDKDTGALRIGSAGHAWLLDPAAFERGFVCWKGRRQGKAWEAFRDEHADKTILTELEWKRALGWATAVMQHPVASQHLAGGLTEHTVEWTDAETGLRCKARVDYVGTRHVELKSTAVIEPRRFSALAARLGYHGQFAFHGDGLRANGHALEKETIAIVVQSEPPHDLVVYRVPEHVIEAGRTLYRDLLRQLKTCMETDRWPGIAPEEIDLVLPEWIYADEEFELTMSGEAMEL